MNKSLQYIKDSVLSGSPIIQIISFEEKRVESHLKMLSEQLKRGDNLQCWDVNNGFVKNGRIVPETKEPVKALAYVLRAEAGGFYVFRDMNMYLKSSPETVRKVREVYRAIRNTRKTVFLLSPDEYFHDALKKEIDVISYELPDYSELQNLFLRFAGSMEKAGIRINLNDEEKKNFIST